MYAYGYGVERDPALAAEWLDQGCERGEGDACLRRVKTALPGRSRLGSDEELLRRGCELGSGESCWALSMRAYADPVLAEGHGPGAAGRLL